jgi:hypothetical protein
MPRAFSRSSTSPFISFPFTSIEKSETAAPGGSGNRYSPSSSTPLGLKKTCITSVRATIPVTSIVADWRRCSSGRMAGSGVGGRGRGGRTWKCCAAAGPASATVNTRQRNGLMA